MASIPQRIDWARLPSSSTLDQNSKILKEHVHLGYHRCAAAQAGMRRRQYSSCDACRSSKRRCEPPTDEVNEHGHTCANCLRLELKCTFDFASTKAWSKPRRRGGKKALRDTTSSLRASQHPLRPAGNALPPRPGGNDPSMDQFDQELGSWLNLVSTGPASPSDMLSSSETLFELSALLTDTTSREDSLPTIEDSGSSALTTSRSWEGSGQNWSSSQRSIQKLSPYSPIGLLNSSLDTNLLSDHLRKIYNTILTVGSSSFLSYRCNLFSTGRRYWFEDSTSLTPSVTFEMESDIFGGFVESRKFPTWTREFLRDRPSHTSPSSSESSTESRIPFDITQRMTPLGVVRFLDHFGDIYGNKLAPTDHKQSDVVLRDVLHAFSTQWMASAGSHPLSDSGNLPDSSILMAGTTDTRHATDLGSNAYLQAWFRARSSLEWSRSIRSFRVVYALFLFDMIAVPLQVSTLPDAPQSSEFLNEGLGHLRVLDSLVQKHCDTLGINSKYGHLLEASLDIFRWLAFLRDTTSSLISGHRKCQYPVFFRSRREGANSRILCPSLDQLTLAPLSDFLDIQFNDRCKEAISEMYIIWRLIDKLPELNTAKRLSFDASEMDLIASTMTELDQFQEHYHPFMRQCFENCARLSIRTKAFSAFLVINWNLSVLTFAEYLEGASSSLPALSALTLKSKITQNRWGAVQSIATMSSKLLVLCPDEELTNETGISSNIPVFSYHATSHLIVKTLVKAIEVAVGLQDSRLFLHGSNLGFGIDANPEIVWSHCVKSLLTCLISLEASLWGSHSARAALHSLMARHGDILAECWSVEPDVDLREPVS